MLVIAGSWDTVHYGPRCAVCGAGSCSVSVSRQTRVYNPSIRSEERVQSSPFRTWRASRRWHQIMQDRSWEMPFSIGTGSELRDVSPGGGQHTGEE